MQGKYVRGFKEAPEKEDYKSNRSDCYRAFLEGFSNVLKAFEFNTPNAGDSGARFCLGQGAVYHPRASKWHQVPFPEVIPEIFALAEL